MSYPKPIPRRALLRGAGGVAVALPFLEAMVPRRARAQPAVPKRFFIWSQPNGTLMERWAPASNAETGFALSDALSPFERHKADMVIVRNLRAPNHAHTYTGCLTGRWFFDDGKTIPNGKCYGAGISIDQHVAQKWAGRTPLPTLQLGVGIFEMQDSNSCVSWLGPRKAAVAENNPFAVYASLFTRGGNAGAPGQAAEVERLIAQRRSALDSVLAQSNLLARRVGASDRAVIDNYLTGVREAEKQLSALAAQSGKGACAPPAVGADPSLPANKKPWWMEDRNTGEVMDLQMRLAVAAMACDMTRIVTLTAAGSGAYGRSYAHVPGVDSRKDWHGWSHAAELLKDKDPRQGDNTILIEKWHYAQVAKLLDGMKGVMQPNGKSLLADSLVFVNNEYGTNGTWSAMPGSPADGKLNNYTHAGLLMPYLLFGQAGGALRTGRQIVVDFLAGPNSNERAWNVWKAEAPMVTQLFVSMLNALDIPDTQFGDPKLQQGPLPRLL